MPRQCQVCISARRAAFEAAVAGGLDVRSAARAAGLHYDAAARHVRLRHAPAAEHGSLTAAETFEQASGHPPMPWQRDFLAETRDTLLVKGRQVGATECASALAIYTARHKPGSTSAIISPSQRQSSEVTVRARVGLWALGEKLRQDSASLLRLANGSRIVSLPGSARGIRGYVADLVVLDEATWLSEATVTAARPLTAATGGPPNHPVDAGRAGRAVLRARHRPARRLGNVHRQELRGPDDLSRVPRARAAGDGPRPVPPGVRSRVRGRSRWRPVQRRADRLDVRAASDRVRLLTRPAPAPIVAASPRPIYTVRAAEAGTAIIGSTRTDDRIQVWRIERLAAGLDPAAAWLRATFPDMPDTGDAHVIVDAADLGRALWDKLNVRFRRGWQLYGKVGSDRQELVNALLVAVSDRRIHVAPSPHDDALRKALSGYRRVVGEDGAIGGELVVALALAVALRRPSPPRVF